MSLTVKIGYPCINLSLHCSASRTFRLSNYSEKRLLDTVSNNLDCLERMIEFNISNNLLFLRITSDLVPFASHPICTFNWQEFFRERFKDIGEKIRKAGMRISMHPDQFVVINSPHEEVFERSSAELAYHAQILDLLKLNDTARIQIHVGGAYGDRENSMERFVKRFDMLENSVKRRLSVENDDKMYGIAHCMKIHQRLNMPVIFDNFHHELNDTHINAKKGVEMAFSTWSKRTGSPMVDFSHQQIGQRRGKHAESVDTELFKIFLTLLNGKDCDVMLEIKDKERSAIKVRQMVNS